MSETSIPKIAPEEQIPFQHIDETDFSSMSRGEQIRHLEVEGYVVFPGILDDAHCDTLSQEMADAEMTAKSYTPYKLTHQEPQWHSQSVCELIGHPPLVDFLHQLMGPDIVFTHGLFQRTHPGSPGISMHTDGQPHGSSLFGFEGSSPRLLPVLYYLDELTPTRAPFRLIPRSHISYHEGASPYIRYRYHPGEITLVMPRGSAVLINSMLFHGTHPNTDTQPRQLIQLGYRPAWAGPIQPMDDWDPADVARAPEVAKPFLQSLNTTGFEWEQPHKPPNMRTESEGIDPRRWE